MAKTKPLDLQAAEARLDADRRTDPLLPTVRWYTARDDRFLRLADLAKRAAQQRALSGDGDAWARIEGLAWLEVAHADDGRSAKKAIAALEAISTPTIETLRWRAHAGAIGALAGRGKDAWLRAAELYRDVLKKAPDDASASLMVAECARRHVKYSLVHSTKWSRVAVPMLEGALAALGTAALEGEPLADRERGLVLALLGRPADAIEPLRRAEAALSSRAELESAWAETRDALVLALNAAERTDEAIAFVHTTTVHRRTVRYELALALARAGRRDALRTLYEGETDVGEHETRLLAGPG